MTEEIPENMEEMKMNVECKIPVDAKVAGKPLPKATVKDLALELRAVAEETNEMATIVRCHIAGAMTEREAQNEKEVLCLADSLEDTLDKLCYALGQLRYTVERLG